MKWVPAACVALGAAFGVLLSWGRLTDPDVIGRMLALEEAYVFLVMGSAIVVGFVGVRLVRRWPGRALLTGEPVRLPRDRPERRHVVGSVVFGAGWALAGACPGPIVAQLGQGTGWALFTAAGVVGGLLLHRIVAERPAATPSAAAQPTA